MATEVDIANNKLAAAFLSITELNFVNAFNIASTTTDLDEGITCIKLFRQLTKQVYNSIISIST